MKRIITLITLILFFQISFTAIGGSQSKAEKISDLLNEYSEYNQFNGSALIAESGKVIHKGGNGWANMEWGIENSSDTKHRLGSITKQFTSMLILQLMQDGKVKLDAPISTYIPNYPKETAEKITLHHLMTHTSGIPNYTSFEGFFRDESRNPYTPEEFLSFFQDSTLNFEPGAEFSYSNSGYFLLGYIIEVVTGNSYEDELRSRIFDPLAMNDSGYDHHNEILKKRATGYERDGIGYINSPYLDMTIPYAAGSLYSTVEDLYKWDQALYTDKLVSNATKELIFGEHIPAGGGHYGYGWFLGDKDGQLEIGHGGGINGFNTLISRYPESKDFVVLFSNTGGADLGAITKGIKAILDAKAYERPKKSVAKEVMAIIQNDGIDKGLKHFESVKSANGYNLNEREMNAIGYQLLGTDQIKEALAIFKLNTIEFPDSWNVFDSYGEGLAMSGDTKAAIQNYTKAVKMNPANTAGIEFLKENGVDVSELVSDVMVDDAILSSYVGKYELQPGFVITITKVGNQLSGQATGQGANKIYPKTDTEFYLKVVEAQLVFNKNAEGVVESLILKQGGREMPAKKVE